MKVLFHPEAYSEAKSSVRYYKNINQQLGTDFQADLKESVSRILQYPQA